MGQPLIEIEPSRARRLADSAWEHRADPARALVEADRARRLATRSNDFAAASVAERTAAIAHLELGESRAALRRARRAVARGAQSGDEDVLAGARISLGGILLFIGRPTESLDVLNLACSSASGRQSIDARAQRAVTLNGIGRRTEALDELESLLDSSAAVQPDELQRAELLHDKGVVLAVLTRFVEAEDSFRSAAEAFDRLDLAPAAFDARRNLALSYVQSARLPQAMRLFDELEAQCGADRQRLVWLLCAQMESVIASNLVTEAVTIVDRLEVAAQFVSADLRAEAWRLCAHAFALAGDRQRSAAKARQSERLFRRQGFTQFAAIARRSASATMSPRRRVIVLGEIIEELAAVGLRSEVVCTRVERLQAAIEASDAGAVAVERAALAQVRRSGGTSIVRLQAWLGEARALQAVGDDRAASRAAHRGLSLLDSYRASLGATELRAHASGIGGELADIGMSAALASGRPGPIFAAAERWRAGALQGRPATSPELVEALAEMRSLLSQRDEMLGRDVDPTHLERRCERAEDAVRRLARGLVGRGESSRSVTMAEIRRSLGDRSLVEVIEHKGQYAAVVADVGRPSRFVRLCSAQAVEVASKELAFALRRLARSGIGEQAATSAAAAAREALDRLDDLLIRPLALRGQQVVIVPPASLLTVPFSALASMSQTEITVTPSATWWSDAQRSAAAGGPVHSGRLLVAGPGLAGALFEVGEIDRQQPGARVLVGSEATTAAVAQCLDGVDLVHIACHGRLRSDHPHLSALELADGPFTVYDFERLAVPPRQVVLAACDTAVGAQRPGDELLGFLTALLGLGTQDVLASVVPVPDVATAAFMSSFHRSLVGGRSFAGALNEAKSAIDVAIPANFAASVAFIAFGIGNSLASA